MSTTDGTDDVGRRRVQLTGVVIVCLGLGLPSLVAWLVNLEQAVRLVAPGWAGVIPENPSGVIQLLVYLSGDLSTVSTLVPVLLFAFPLVQALRMLRRSREDSASIHAMEALPYPAHFPFFLVMLGLTGTLYGLWIGLSVSGVSAVAKGVPSAEDLPVVLDRLLDGTATALLSSLLGLIGAFLAAKPLPYVFERAACLEPAEEERSLAETIDHLTRDLKTLSAATREFTTCLRPEAVTGALDAITSMKEAVTGQTETVRQAAQSLEKMADAQREGLQHLQAVPGIAAAVEQSGQRLDPLAGLLEQMIATESRMADTLGSLLGEVQEERRESAEQLAALRAAVEKESDAARTDRDQLRKAFSAYVGG